MYSRDDIPLMTSLRRLTESNRAALSAAAKRQLQEVEDWTNLQHRFLSRVIWTWKVPEAGLHVDDPRRLAFAAFHKDLLLCLSAYELTLQGLYGPARVLFRSVFEWLLIAKYCCSGGAFEVLKRWEAGDEVWVSNAILRKIVNPDATPLKTFWRELCQFAHATTQSGQVDIDVRLNIRECRFNIVILTILLRCNYHLLNIHLISRAMEYYEKRYGLSTDDLRQIRSEARGLAKTASPLSVHSRRLLTAYQRCWIVT